MLASRFVRVPPSRVPSLSVSGDLSAEGCLTQGLGGSIFMLEPRHAGSVVSAADPEEDKGGWHGDDRQDCHGGSKAIADDGFREHSHRPCPTNSADRTTVASGKRVSVRVDFGDCRISKKQK